MTANVFTWSAAKNVEKKSVPSKIDSAPGLAALQTIAKSMSASATPGYFSFQSLIFV